MKAVAFLIQKGGQEKTSLSGNVAHIISENSKVLLVDGGSTGLFKQLVIK